MGILGSLCKGSHDGRGMKEEGTMVYVSWFWVHNPKLALFVKRGAKLLLFCE